MNIKLLKRIRKNIKVIHYPNGCIYKNNIFKENHLQIWYNGSVNVIFIKEKETPSFTIVNSLKEARANAIELIICKIRNEYRFSKQFKRKYTGKQIYP